jgi:hypothetical protein
MILLDEMVKGTGSGLQDCSGLSLKAGTHVGIHIKLNVDRANCFPL